MSLPPDARHIDPVRAAAELCTSALDESERVHRARMERLHATAEADAYLATTVARLRAEVAHEPQFNASAMPPHTAGEPTAEEIDAAHERALAVVRVVDRSSR